MLAEVELIAKKIAGATPELQLLAGPAGPPPYETNPSRGCKRGFYGSCTKSLSLLDFLEELARPSHQVLQLAAFEDGITRVEAVGQGVRVARERTG